MDARVAAPVASDFMPQPDQGPQILRTHGFQRVFVAIGAPAEFPRFALRKPARGYKSGRDKEPGFDFEFFQDLQAMPHQNSEPVIESDGEPVIIPISGSSSPQEFRYRAK